LIPPSEEEMGVLVIENETGGACSNNWGDPEVDVRIILQHILRKIKCEGVDCIQPVQEKLWLKSLRNPENVNKCMHVSERT
jgi:hypothetical protein